MSCFDILLVLYGLLSTLESKNTEVLSKNRKPTLVEGHEIWVLFSKDPC